MHKVIGTCRKDVNNSFIDYYSIGHFVMGYITYIVSIWIWSLLPFEFDIYEISLVSTLMVGIIWEILENYLLVDTPLKFEKRRDSLGNSLMDIIFVFIGGAMCRSYIEYEVIDFLIITIWVIIIAFICFDILKTLTHNNKKNEIR